MSAVLCEKPGILSWAKSVASAQQINNYSDGPSYNDHSGSNDHTKDSG
jgi:hypothetical protein